MNLPSQLIHFSAHDCWCCDRWLLNIITIRKKEALLALFWIKLITREKYWPVGSNTDSGSNKGVQYRDMYYLAFIVGNLF